MTEMNAYFDDYNAIELQTSKDNVVLEPFRLESKRGEIATNIVYRYEDEDYRYYGLRFSADVVVGERYYLVSRDEAIKTPVKYRFITKTARFDAEFNYTGPLGTSYAKDTTIFRLWAPTAEKAELLIRGKVLNMERRPQGLFILVLRGDYDGAVYNYLVTVNGAAREVIDPYSLSLTPNSLSSVVIDPKKIKLAPKKALKKLAPSDYLIYELSAFDYSNNRFFKNKGKYVAFLEENRNDYKDPIGLDYIKSLGVSHVQLQPILDFATKDDYNPYGLYNWGYDPASYFAMEGSYATDAKDPYLRITEVQDMIRAIREKGMRVVLDVVYNHMYRAESTALNLIVPYYYFGYKNKRMTNGSLAGNDLDTARNMVSKMICDSVTNLIRIYGIDGLRLDLMGNISIELVDKLYKISRELDDSFIIYGEGWMMNRLLDDNNCASLRNASRLANIGFFNDYFRDNVSGQSWLSGHQFGYALGDVSKCVYAMDVLRGHHADDFVNPLQSINYLECHDGLALIDKIVKECGAVDEDKAILCMAMLILAQGIPYIHMGQDFLKSKKMNDNTYLNMENENDFDWNDISRKKRFVDVTRQLINFRQSHPELFYATEEEVKENVDINEYYRSIIYKNKNFTIVFNGNEHQIVYPDIVSPNILLGNKMSLTRDRELRLDASAFAIILNEE